MEINGIGSWPAARGRNTLIMSERSHLTPKRCEQFVSMLGDTDNACPHAYRVAVQQPAPNRKRDRLCFVPKDDERTDEAVGNRTHRLRMHLEGILPRIAG